MIVAISIETNKAQLKKLNKEVKEARDRLSNIDEPMAKVSIMLDRWVQKNFRSEGGNVGGWKPLKAGGRWVKNQGFDSSAKTLQDTGRLRSSFKPFADKNRAGIGSALEYSINHEEGIGVPVRRMLPKAKDVEAQAKKLIEASLFKDI